MQRPVEVHGRFLMHGNPRGACFGERRDELIGIFDHQVAVKWNITDRFPQGGYHGRANRDVRHEVSIHDVNVQDCTAAIDRALCMCAKPGEIGRQDRWSELNQRYAP